MITLTIVRHGESKDNLRGIWAGWKDAPLSNHGMNQARALGKSFAEDRIDAVLASPLKRALWTGQQVQEQNRHNPPLTISPLLREQHFGDAEGEIGTFEKGKPGWYLEPGREFRFPNGENLHDVRGRAEQALTDLIEPHLVQAYGLPAEERHVVLVAHGIFISELISAILARRPQGHDGTAYRGMTNTGWARVNVGYVGEQPSTKFPADAAPGQIPLTATVAAWDVTTHLDGVKRQGGGIGSAAYDEKQQDIRAFFSGAGTKTETEAEALPN